MTDLTLQEAIAGAKTFCSEYRYEVGDELSTADALILNAVVSGELIPLADHKLAVADAFRRALGAIADLPTPLHEETKCGHEDAYRAVAALEGAKP